MKNQHFTIKVLNALAGLRFAWRDERNFRTHIWLSLITLAVFFWLQPAAIWWALIILSIALVLAAELINSAVEALSDHLHPDIHPSIGKVKDMLAGMVLVVSIAAAIIALLAIFASLKA